jgi:putative membrane protein
VAVITAPLVRGAFLGAVAGAAATFAKTKAEGFLQPRAEKLLPPSPAAKAAIGGDGSGHPESMPPAEVADRVQHAVTGDELTDEQRLKAAAPLHWGMGVGFAAAYGAVSTVVPAVRTGRGTLAGAFLFTAAHGIALPAAHLQHPPAQLPRAWWIWEAGSHVFYGVVLDASFDVLQRLVSLARD